LTKHVRAFYFAMYFAAGPRGMLGAPCLQRSICYDQFSVCSPGGVCVCRQGSFSKSGLCSESTLWLIKLPSLGRGHVVRYESDATSMRRRVGYDERKEITRTQEMR